MKKNAKPYHPVIPNHVIETLGQYLYSEMVKFYQTAEGQKYFEEWKAEQEKLKKIQ